MRHRMSEHKWETSTTAARLPLHAQARVNLVQRCSFTREQAQKQVICSDVGGTFRAVMPRWAMCRREKPSAASSTPATSLACLSTCAPTPPLPHSSSLPWSSNITPTSARAASASRCGGAGHSPVYFFRISDLLQTTRVTSLRWLHKRAKEPLQ